MVGGKGGERPLGICCFSSCQQLEEDVDLGKVRLRALLSRVGSQFCNSGLIHEPNLISIRQSQRERGEGERQGEELEQQGSSPKSHRPPQRRQKEMQHRQQQQRLSGASSANVTEQSAERAATSL